MSEDWRLQRAAEIFGGPLPAGGGDVLPLNFDRRSDDNAGRRSADRRKEEAPPPGGSTAQSPVVTGPAQTAAAWPWRWRLLAVFLALQTALIVWLVVGRPTPVQRVVFVTPPPVAPSPRIDAAAVRASRPPTVAPVPATPKPEATPPVVAAQVALPARIAKPAKAVVAASKPATRPAATVPAARRPRARPANAPSYDCRRNHGAVMVAICGDPSLAALDRQLAARFAALDASVDPATVQRIHRGETAFLNQRQSCPDRTCLVAAYRNRLRELGDE